MFQLGLIVIAMFAVQAVLSGLQMRHFSKEFIKLRRRGKVACGRKSGGFHAGAIVMFLIDGDGVIQESRKLCGVTCFARVKPLAGFEGKYVGGLTDGDLPKYGKNLRKAILDARDSYNKFISGEAIPEPPSPLRRAGQALTGIVKS
ncbi:MAG: transcriptional regulator GutM [Oscillospiraceae bacterium]|nr:transcriptional regulator GutM [Oscillospiraceae bacterium]